MVGLICIDLIACPYRRWRWKVGRSGDFRVILWMVLRLWLAVDSLPRSLLWNGVVGSLPQLGRVLIGNSADTHMASTGVGFFAW